MSDQLLHQIELNLKLLKFLDCEALFFKFFFPQEGGWVGMQIFEAHFSNRWFTSKGLMDSVRTHR